MPPVFANRNREVWKIAGGIVIGASSFDSGYAVQAFLEAKYEVIGAVRNTRFTEYYARKDVKYISFDLDKPNICASLPRDAGIVIHLADRPPTNSTFNR